MRIAEYADIRLWQHVIALLTQGFPFYQPYVYSSTMQTVNDETKFIKYLIRDAKLKLKLALVLLPLALTTPQVFSNVNRGSFFLGLVVYINIVTLFLSITLHIVAIACYKAILRNPAGLDVFMSHAHDVVGTPPSLDPKLVALLIPSAWTFLSFFLFFIVLILTGLETVTTTGPVHSSGSLAMEVQGYVIATLLFGLINGVALVITWRKYIHAEVELLSTSRNLMVIGEEAEARASLK